MKWLALLWALAAGYGQPLSPSTPFPRLEGETLAETQVALPDQVKGRPAAFVFSFSQEAGKNTAPWMERLGRQYSGQVESYSVAMLEAAPRFVRGMIRSGMRKDMPKSAQQRMVLLYKDEKLWRTRLNVTDEKLPVIVLLDKDGKLIFTYSGLAGPDGWTQVDTRIRSILAGR